MALTGHEAVKKGFVIDSDPKSVRPASYDLTIGSILIEGESHAGASVKPQQTFIIVSKERVKVPAGFVAYAMPKTRLCNTGILALNTGVVDPGYDGPLSTIAINFSESHKPLCAGTPFLRLVFNSLEGERSGDEDLVVAESDQKRIERSKEFPETFLDVPGQTEPFVRKVADEALGKQTNFFLLILAGATVIFALWNIGAYVLLGLQEDSVGTSSMRAEVKEIARLEGRVDALEAMISHGRQLQVRAPSPKKAN